MNPLAGSITPDDLTIEGEIKESVLVPAIPSELAITTAPAEVLEQARQAAKALTDVIKGKPHPVRFRGETYLEYEDWQTVGRFYNVTARVVDVRAVTVGEATGWQATADAIRDGQVVSSATALCLNDEANWKGKPMAQLMSMAQTRACSKSLRNVLAWVVVLAGYKPTPAEEMPREPDPPPGERIKTPTSADIERERKATIAAATGPMPDVVAEADYMRLMEIGRVAKESTPANYAAFSAWLEAEFGGWVNFTNRGGKRVDEAVAILTAPVSVPVAVPEALHKVTDIKASPTWRRPAR